MSSNDFDIAVVGSGFAGSLLAMICRRLGHSVVLIEKGKHPRFAIGESSTPLTNLLLEELARRYDLPALLPFAKWGTWQRTYSAIPAGLKRGFSFFHHSLGETQADHSCEKQLLVAASPQDEIADTHWFRPDFDQFFVEEAKRQGVCYWDETSVDAVQNESGNVTLTARRGGRDLSFSARFIVDATGPRGFLHQNLGLPELGLESLPHTSALYSHFVGVGSYATRCLLADAEAPYPIDAAAVHHVFEGGWIWVLQFNNGITSAGIAAMPEVVRRLHLQDGAVAWHALLRKIPAVDSQFANAQPIRPFTFMEKLPFRSGQIVGRNWLQLPSAAGFVDPLLSSGFALTLLGIERIARLFEKAWPGPDLPALLEKYAAQTERELLAVARLIGALYANMDRFNVFSGLSLLYFTAVIYSETMRRLGKPELAPSFLLVDHPYFGARYDSLLQQAVKLSPSSADSERFVQSVREAIEPLNLAGLGDPARCNWYPVVAQDLYDNAAKVGATEDDVTALLRRAGFTG